MLFFFERIFSPVASAKTKARNKVPLSLFDAVMRIRPKLLISNKCFNEFPPTAEMLKDFINDKSYTLKSICSVRMTVRN